MTHNMTSLSSFATKVESKSSKKEPRMITATPTVSAAINKFVEQKTAMDRAKAEMERAGAIVKEAGRTEAVNIFERGEEFASFRLASKENSLMYILQDRFTKLDPDKAKAAAAVLGVKYLQQTTEYKFNSEMLEKHGAKIAKAIASLNIPDEDRAKLLVATDMFEYTFGLNEIPAVAKEIGKPIDLVIETVQPVQQLKGGNKK